MPRGAPRLLIRLWRGLARGVLLPLVFVAPGAAAQGVASIQGQDCHQPDGPPGHVVAESESGPLVRARYVGATTAYGHGVLGDAIEAEGLLVQIASDDGPVCATVQAGPNRVFEDVGPRLFDVTQNGIAEVLVVASHQKKGARLEIYGLSDSGGGFQLLAAGPYIGQRFRWLAPVGAADLDGDGRVEIAYVDRPHLAKTLRIWRWTDAGLIPVADAPGVTNHRIGDPFIIGGIRDCGTLPEMILASADWSRLLTLRFDGANIARQDLGSYGADAMDDALACR
ncbi:MAG: VCBS repeat-containing protein [Pseudomonadota bacterium]